MEKYMLPCLNKSVFGVDCFGCGTQRALALLFQGEFKQAFLMFPAIYTLILFFAVIFLHFVDRYRTYHTAIITLAVVNAVIMVVSYLGKYFF